MSLRTSTRLRLGSVRQYPVDLAVVSVAAVVASVVVTSFAAGNSLRLLATLPLVLFLPGYALVSMLFPAAERDARETAATEIETYPRGIDVAERLGLSFVLSISILPLLALALPATEWGLATEPLAGVLGAITVVCAQLGVVRRLRTPDAERFTVTPLVSFAWLRRGEGAVATASSILLVAAVATAVGALLVGFIVPTSTGGFTELGLYTENEDGDLVAGELPDEIEPGESIPVTVTVENHEGEETAYTLVIQEQTLEDGTVVDRTRLQEIDATVSADATATGERTITPTATPGETVRISALLYEGEPPAEPTNDNAAEDTYFWITVSDE
ncbi:DUF1616 domain-containing protein [Halopiger djelfimassiliensis]|uniref:DUF1616 domain-containing protein n=1 Tax=Halopiger djelfimassiliensis TaxID=1293047 RepID=UPI0006779CB7|nr:DUF1616 domain-containing protein [Halopiger djelfimassiliensis]